jgi:hypothetical protein
MDASMRQKVALTAAHLLCEGRIADMGMGSGTGTEALAALYPALHVVGVDVNETMVALARERFDLPNLEFVVGDIAAPVFPPGSLDGIFDSSVLHHVTSFNGYDHDAAARALAVQVEELHDGGVLVVRDFVAPEAGEVLLDLPSDDGDASDDPRTCSTAALFERFARELRPLSDEPGFSYEAVSAASGAPPLRVGRRRFRTDRRMAVELLLRKDYRADWEAEVKEEYTYFTQARFEEVFASLGLRVLASTPILNPWIAANRFVGRFEMYDARTGALEELPATNYVIVGEKVPRGEGVAFRDAGTTAPLGFLELCCYRDVATGAVRDLVRRPHRTLDVLPFFEVKGELFVLARMSYPRPILGTLVPALDGSRPPGYVTEPLNVEELDKPEGQTVEEALARLAAIEDGRIRRFVRGGTYYPSPGGIQEEVRSLLVEVEPVFVEDRIAPQSGFSTSGRVRALEARQLLRAAQVGGLPDARLELNVYDLLHGRGESLGPWIGDAIALADRMAPVRVASLEALAARPSRRRFTRVSHEASPGFLALECRRFEEIDRDGSVVAARALELVRPRALSLRTVACAPLRRSGDRIFLGVDDDDLPAAQCFAGNSELLVAPAWRLPHDVTTRTPAFAFVRARLAEEYGAQAGAIWELGGRYHPSPGLTAEVVHLLAVEIESEREGAARALTWVPLETIPSARHTLEDGHLRIAALRAHHALLGG